jgi:hypothetical protein
MARPPRGLGLRLSPPRPRVHGVGSAPVQLPHPPGVTPGLARNPRLRWVQSRTGPQQIVCAKGWRLYGSLGLGLGGALVCGWCGLLGVLVVF